MASEKCEKENTQLKITIQNMKIECEKEKKELQNKNNYTMYLIQSYLTTVYRKTC